MPNLPQLMHSEGEVKESDVLSLERTQTYLIQKENQSDSYLDNYKLSCLRTFFTHIVFFYIIYVNLLIESEYMRIIEAENELRHWDDSGKYIFTKSDLRKILNESPNTLTATIKRLITAGILTKVAHNLYMYSHSKRIGATTLEDIALNLRRGDYVFESLESALSQWGLISQVPLDRITCMTTGRSGEYTTPFGTIEFTHTSNPTQIILDNTIMRPGHPLPIATKSFAIRNLKRVGRNLNMIEEEAPY